LFTFKKERKEKVMLCFLCFVIIGSLTWEHNKTIVFQSSRLWSNIETTSK